MRQADPGFAGIGAPIDRLDGRLKVTGAARYAAEVPVDGVAYAMMVQSTVGCGRITRIHASDAEAAAGVLAVLTPDNAMRLPDQGRAAFNPPAGRMLSLLQDHEVHYNGQPVALVVAESLEQARHAAALVRCEYEAREPDVDMERMLAKSYPYTAKILGRDPPATKRGDVSAGMRASRATIDVVYRTPIETHNPIEPHATVAAWEGDRLTLYDATQFVYGVRAVIAKTFGISEDRVRVIGHFTGGAFGSKGAAWSHVPLAAMAAKHVGRPVKLVLTRRQMFGPVGARPFTVQHVTIAGREDGALGAIRHVATSSTSTMEEWLEPSTLATRMLYACDNVETSQHLVRLNTGTPTFNRAPGEASGSFALESAMDELAVALGIDPLALRLRNYAEEDPEEHTPWSSKSLRECYRVAADRFGWFRRDPRVGAMRDGDARIGWGMATATYPMKRMPASATATLRPDGVVELRAATHEIGTGTITIMQQIAADTLGLPIERVAFLHGDTELPRNPISAGSMTATSTGSAILVACRQLRERLASLGHDDPARARVREAVGVTVDAKPGDEREHWSMHAFGAVCAEVRVDQELGTVRLSRIVGAYAGGRVLNPKTARSQLVGGIVYGIGMALLEDTHLDPRTGRYMNAELDEYHLPVSADVPPIDVTLVEERDEHVNPLGVKGLGEIGITGVAAAIANAVYHATGVRVRDLPITVDKVMRPA